MCRQFDSSQHHKMCVQPPPDGPGGGFSSSFGLFLGLFNKEWWHDTHVQHQFAEHPAGCFAQREAVQEEHGTHHRSRALEEGREVRPGPMPGQEDLGEAAPDPPQGKREGGMGGIGQRCPPGDRVCLDGGMPNEVVTAKAKRLAFWEYFKEWADRDCSQSRRIAAIPA